MQNPQPKRFIAGATCPSCHTQDTLYWSKDTKGDYVACTRCQHYQSMSELNQTDSKPTKGEVIQIVKI